MKTYGGTTRLTSRGQTVVAWLVTAGVVLGCWALAAITAVRS